MFRIADALIKKDQCKALVTGDNLGQVSSQILETMTLIRKASTSLIISPLIGFDKQEIVDLAKKIGTYEISIQPYGDCCSFYIDKHPELKPQEHTVETIEKNFNTETLIRQALEQTQTIRF